MTVSAEPRAAAWPDAIFDAPVLRGLEARARGEIEAAGNLVRLGDGDALFREGETAASFYVVARGAVRLDAVRRGEAVATELRVARAGETIGEEAIVDVPRRGRAVASGDALVAEIPVHVFRRAAARSGKAEVAERLERALLRRAARDVLATVAFARDLAPADLDALLDAAVTRRVPRGEAVYAQGDPATELCVVADGLVQIQTEDLGRVHVRAYLARGDFFGDEEILDREPRAASAVAAAPTLLLAIPAAIVRDLARRAPSLWPRLRRLARDRSAEQQALVGRAAANATQHVFRDVYRLEVARSLLVIDLESCARCGHCAWACADLHGGVPRIVRRGDKVVTPLADGAEARTLMLPSSCQHCEHPACMVDCPTGAIGRDPAGDVFIREELCTGCGACARGCPWDNIQIAKRPDGAPRPAGEPGAYGEVAVKCDLCAGHDGPACVAACPTEAIFRMNPAEELPDVRAFLGVSHESAASSRRTRGASRPIAAGAAIASLGIVLARVRLGAALRPGTSAGLAFGIAAAIGMVALLAYAAPKRIPRLLRRTKSADHDGTRARSRLRPHAVAHTAIGLVTLALAIGHAPWPLARAHGIGAALLAALALASLAGMATALAYALVPARLTRIERTAALPEDLANARAALLARLYREASGRSDLVKKILEKILLPYARAALGPIALVLSGRRLRDEEQRLRARIDRVLEGRGQERLAGLPELVRIVVELRAIPAQRAMQRAIRVGLPLHVVSFAVAMALLVLHVVEVTR